LEPLELDTALEELETRVERLRALYEQYFMGIEKIPPAVVHKDVERRIYSLRREQIRNTAKRFKLQTIIQRYNTFQQYWQRILREIESGTYRRHVLRAERTVGLIMTELATLKPPPSDTTTADDVQLDIEAPTPSSQRRSAAPSSPRHSEMPLLRPTSPPTIAKVEEFTRALERDLAAALDADPYGDELLGGVRNKAFELDEPWFSPGQVGGVNVALSPQQASPASTESNQSTQKPEVKAVEARPAKHTPTPEMVVAVSPHGQTPDPAPVGLRGHLRLPIQSAIGGHRLPPAQPSKPSVTSSESRPLANAAVVSHADSPISSVQVPGLSAARVQQLHRDLTEARALTAESGNVTIDALARKLEATTKTLLDKHAGKRIDFAVVVRDGKAVIKPVVR
jgi:hypothetical protein